MTNDGDYGTPHRRIFTNFEQYEAWKSSLTRGDMVGGGGKPGSRAPGMTTVRNADEIDRKLAKVMRKAEKEVGDIIDGARIVEPAREIHSSTGVLIDPEQADGIMNGFTRMYAAVKRQTS